MSNILNVKEAKEWLGSWREASTPRSFARRVAITTYGAATNLAGMEADRRFPGGIDPEQARASVKMLLAVVRETIRDLPDDEDGSLIAVHGPALGRWLAAQREAAKIKK